MKRSGTDAEQNFLTFTDSNTIRHEHAQSFKCTICGDPVLIVFDHVFLLSCDPSAYRYKILAPQAVEQSGGDPKKAASAILDASGLDPDQYRLGHTKARSLSRSRSARYARRYRRLCLLIITSFARFHEFHRFVTRARSDRPRGAINCAISIC